MYQVIDKHTFIDQFRTMGRMTTRDGESNFTYNGLCALFDYLEELESDVGEEMEFDVIALCCQFSEYGSALEAVEDYDPSFAKMIRDDSRDRDDAEQEALEWIEYRTSVVEFPGGIIIDTVF